MNLTRRQFTAGASALALSPGAPARAFFPGPAVTEEAGEIVIGADTFACARALADTRILVLEKGLHPAGDFLLTFAPAAAGTPVSARGKELAAFWRANGALTADGRLRHARACDLFTVFLADRGARVYGGAIVSDTARTADDGWRVTVAGPRGPEAFGARKVTVTPARPARAVTGILTRAGKDAADGAVRLFRVPLPPGATPARARLALGDAWAARRREFPGWELAAEAGALERDSPYPDFFAAFEAGLAAGGARA